MEDRSAFPPLVSIGLPVYNGQNYLSQAIESVLNQTYKNLELIISDNGSTDDTANICKSYAEKDTRIRIYRFEENQGASRNFNITIEKSSGKYFKWLAHDDMMVPQNIEKSVEAIESNPDCVLCGSAKKNVSFNGEIIDTYDYKGLHLLNDDNTLSRYQEFLNHFSGSFTDADFVLTGLMRLDILKQTICLANYTSGDFTLLADLVLKGKFIILNDPLYIKRFHHGFSMSVNNNNPDAINLDPSAKIKYKSHAEVAKWFDPKGKVRRFPHLTWLNELLRSIGKNDFSEVEKSQLRKMSFHWFLKRTSKSVSNKFKKVISLI